MQGQEDLLGDVIPCFMVLFTRYNKCWCLYMYDMLNLTQIGLQRVENMRKIPKQSWKVSKITGMFLEFTGNVPTFYNPKHKIR